MLPVGVEAASQNHRSSASTESPQASVLLAVDAILGVLQADSNRKNGDELRQAKKACEARLWPVFGAPGVV